jgi:hypothetical protein
METNSWTGQFKVEDQTVSAVQMDMEQSVADQEEKQLKKLKDQLAAMRTQDQVILTVAQQKMLETSKEEAELERAPLPKVAPITIPKATISLASEDIASLSARLAADMQHQAQAVVSQSVPAPVVATLPQPQVMSRSSIRTPPRAQRLASFVQRSSDDPHINEAPAVRMERAKAAFANATAAAERASQAAVKLQRVAQKEIKADSKLASTAANVNAKFTAAAKKVAAKAPHPPHLPPKVKAMAKAKLVEVHKASIKKPR